MLNHIINKIWSNRIAFCHITTKLPRKSLQKRTSLLRTEEHVVIILPASRTEFFHCKFSRLTTRGQLGFTRSLLYTAGSVQSISKPWSHCHLTWCASYTTILSISPFSCRRYDWTDEASIAELTDGMLSKHEGNTTITFTKERKTETSLFLKCLQWRCSCTIAFKNYLLSFTQSKSHHSEGGTVPRLCVKDKKLKKHIQWDVNYSRLSAPSELTYQCQGGWEPTTLEGLLQWAPSRPCYLGTKAKPQSILNATFAHTLWTVEDFWSCITARKVSPPLGKVLHLTGPDKEHQHQSPLFLAKWRPKWEWKIIAQTFLSSSSKKR